MSMQRVVTTACLVVAVLLGGAILSTRAGAQAEAKKDAATAKIEVKSTLENLQAAFNGESNANKRYLAFAKKADEEGYGKVASLFRAAAKAESIHAKNHAAVIKKLGGEAKADLKEPEVKSTKENLAEAIKGETYEFKVMYPAFLAKARSERNRDAMKTINYALQVEKGHAKLYQEALDNLASWKAPGTSFYVCKVCGNTVAKIDFTRCPVCMEPKSEYQAVS